MSFDDPTQPPEISVIIPVHNGAAFLSACLGRIFASEYESYECIVVNDGSTDGSAAIARRFAARVIDLSGGPRGPAFARNRGAELARGRILFFVDADVVLAPEALERVAKTFAEKPDLAAVFGSYDANPAAAGLISQYRNLLHHFVHQNGSPNASTFWAGCGAIRRSVFEKVGGFDEKRFPRASIEDVELGYRVREMGLPVLLDKELQCTHLKRWNLSSLVRTDITNRAMPWAQLILETKILPNDLNVSLGQRLSFAFLALSCLLLPLALVQSQLIIASAAGLLSVAVFNRHLYAFFFRERGAVFAAGCFPLHLLYLLYSGLTYLYVWTQFQLRRAATIRAIASAKSAARSILSAKS